MLSQQRYLWCSTCVIRSAAAQLSEIQCSDLSTSDVASRSRGGSPLSGLRATVSEVPRRGDLLAELDC